MQLTMMSMISSMRHGVEMLNSMLTLMCAAAVYSNNSTTHPYFYYPGYSVAYRLAYDHYLYSPIRAMLIEILSFAVGSRRTIAHANPAIFPILLVLWLQANLAYLQISISAHPVNEAKHFLRYCLELEHKNCFVNEIILCAYVIL